MTWDLWIRFRIPGPGKWLQILIIWFLHLPFFLEKWDQIVQHCVIVAEHQSILNILLVDAKMQDYFEPGTPRLQCLENGKRSRVSRINFA